MELEEWTYLNKLIEREITNTITNVKYVIIKEGVCYGPFYDLMNSGFEPINTIAEPS